MLVFGLERTFGGTNVLDASAFQNSTDRAAGDNAGTGGSGTHQNAACAVLADDLVRNGGALKGNGADVLLCILKALADSVGNFVRLTHAKAYDTVAVTNNNQCGKLHDTSALNGLGYTVYSYDFLVELIVVSV